MNKPNNDHKNEQEPSEAGDDLAAATETTPILGKYSYGAVPTATTAAAADKKPAYQQMKTEMTQLASSFESMNDADDDNNGNEVTTTKDVVKQSHLSTVIIMVLLLAIILFAAAAAAAASFASKEEQEQAADHYFNREEAQSAMDIALRPCQFYYYNDADHDDDRDLIHGSTSTSTLQVIETRLGSPSTHWGKIPCMVQKQEKDVFQDIIHETSSTWNGLWTRKQKQKQPLDPNNHDHDNTNNNDNTNDNTSNEPLEYGLPSANIQIDFSNIAHPQRQPILGFGGAFTEASALNYLSLNEDGRDALMSLLFGKDGLGYTLGRVHMNSCDFSIESYNFDNVDGDFNLTHFDSHVEHDVSSGMIEMMLKANDKLKNDWRDGDGGVGTTARKSDDGNGIQIMVSPWSPPAWMKSPTKKDPIGALHAVNMTGSAEPTCLREGTGADSKYAAAWALYFSKFLTACESNV